ncbi:hypothetical protein DES36_11382 [Alkalibaculum bacchi]|uniref:Uncharacterized protein n=1 Tax=Alkalibaculum bacchi TaxID=645887 RepID=A0A366I384_9FIRM|nr:hypothetical protein [Alkalibaculum bacchi]RBP61864.1 hypothetical protein DES36_11382 [Alkalibaculum bacchi]
MKKYYAERNRLIKNPISISFDELKSYFIKTYQYFSNKEYLECATKGVWRLIPYSNNEEQIIPPSLAPDPEVFFTTRLQDRQVWPIYEYSEYYTEEILFSVIEILYDHIALYDYKDNKLMQEVPREEYAEHINNILRMYNGGYYIEPTNGFIMKLPNEILKQQLSYDGKDMPNRVFEQLSTAASMFYRFDSNMETKKKAINILADILENEREELKNILNEEYKIPKNEHDKLIFGIVNGYNIRHNRADQKGNYSKEIWYDWMMQYYTSVIIAFYKLKTKKEIEKLF